MDKILRRCRSLGRKRALILGLGGVMLAGLLVSRVWVGNGAELNKAPMPRVIGRVMDVGEWSVTVNLGKRDGVEKGMLMEVSRSTVVETDQATGQPAVVRVEKIAEMTVLDVDEVGAEAIPAADRKDMPPIQVGDEVRPRE